MAQYCLTKPLAELFKQKLKSGEINPEKLAAMTSTERHAYFASFLGEHNATNVNSLFESKLLLKSQKQGMITWAKKVTGISQVTRKTLIDKINSMDRVFNPKEQEQFLHDLASTSIGADLTQEEAKTIFDLSQKATEAKAKIDIKNKQSLVDYGNKVLDIQDYIDKIAPTHENWLEKLVNLANLPKSALTSVFHLSAPFVQGWGMSTTKEFWQGFGQMFKYFAKPQAYRDLQAYIIAHPDYPLAKAGKLGITKLGDKLTVREEAIQSSILEHIPGLKVLVGASSRSFTGFLNYVRFSRFTNLLDAARIAGEDVSKDSQVVKDIANVVNDFTGRGQLGKNDKYGNTTPFLNALFFSPRKIVATVNMFNPARYLDPRISPTAKKAAWRQLIGSLVATSSILGLAALAGAKIETDPTSTNFGKIQIGNTSIDITGTNKTFIVLLARLYEGKIKSSSTDVFTPLGGGYGGITRGDILLNFFRSKLSPIASGVANWLYTKDLGGNPFNLTNELYNEFTPIVIQDAINFMKNDPKNTAAILPALSGIFGVGIQSTSSAPATPSSKEWQGLLSKVGNTKYQEAYQEYSTEVKNKEDKLQKDSRFNSLSDTQKKSITTSIENSIKKKVFNKYGYKYKIQKTNKNPTVKELINLQ